MDFPYKLGKNAASGAKRLNLGDYLNTSMLPTPPDEFGHEGLVADYQMLGNADWGDCAIAGPYHCLQLWNAEGGHPFNITTQRVLQTYSDITGFDINAGPSGENPTDRGSNLDQVAEYWRVHGFEDSSGGIHKIETYVALRPGDIEQLWHACYLFDGLGVGIRMPQEWMTDFMAGRPWDRIDNPTIAGGHLVTGVARRNGNLVVVTWGRLQEMTPAAYQMVNDETLVYLDTDKLINGKDINGFDIERLRHDIWELARC